MTRRIDYRSDRQRRRVTEQGYESWNGSVIGEGLGKLDRSEYDPRTRATDTPEKADATPRERAKPPPKSKVKRIPPDSPEGKKIAEEALRATSRQPQVQISPRNSTEPKLPASPNPSITPRTPPETPRQHSPRHPAVDKHATAAVDGSVQTSGSIQPHSKWLETPRWLLWLIPVLLVIATIWASR